MNTTNFDSAQILWRARDEMVWAADEFQAADQVVSAVAADAEWQSDAARMFHESAEQLVMFARCAVSECWDEADILLARANRMLAP